MKKLLLLLFLISSVTIAQAADFIEGKDYERVAKQETKNPDKVEVLEFFWYGCPHCYTFEPHLVEWKKNLSAKVDFIRAPAGFFPIWKIHARMYYSLQMLGVGEKLHPLIFDEIHKHRKKLDSIDKITIFVEKHGVDRTEFIDTFSSFAVENKVRKTNKLSDLYGISGVPTVIVNGKYKITGQLAGTYGNLIKIINHLVKMESKK